MDLWIRSQDGETMMKVDRVDYSDGHIVGYQPNDDVEIILATYREKEKAMNILNEIWNLLKPHIEVNDTIDRADLIIKLKIYENMRLCYELPKD